MPTYARYKPSKTQLTMSELKATCEELKDENRKLKAKLHEAQKSRAWAIERLQDEQFQNRQLGITIMQLVERGGRVV